ncbi:MAG: prepilin peptidase [Desulfomonilaceae bacterium]|nr:prepilin peptidase [Desulfomonilaceae bacterium]
MPYYEIYCSVTFFILGAVVGSFLNVVILRVPEGASIVHPPSRCPDCGSAVRFYDNVPILSFLVLGGRCRDCGSRISFRYPLIEFTTALLSLALYKKFGISPAFMVFFPYCCAMIVVFWIDLDHMIIPDVITINGIAVGVIVSLVGFIPYMNIKTSLLGTLFGGAILYLPAIVYEKLRGAEGLGGGDIKLLATIGAFSGVHGVIFVLFFASLVGSAVALVTMAVKGSSAKTPIPFGPFLTTTGIVYVFVGQRVIDNFYALSHAF